MSNMRSDSNNLKYILSAEWLAFVFPTN